MFVNNSGIAEILSSIGKDSLSEKDKFKLLLAKLPEILAGYPAIAEILSISSNIGGLSKEGDLLLAKLPKILVDDRAIAEISSILDSIGLFSKQENMWLANLPKMLVNGSSVGEIFSSFQKIDSVSEAQKSSFSKFINLIQVIQEECKKLGDGVEGATLKVREIYKSTFVPVEKKVEGVVSAIVQARFSQDIYDEREYQAIEAEAVTKALEDTKDMLESQELKINIKKYAEADKECISKIKQITEELSRSLCDAVVLSIDVEGFREFMTGIYGKLKEFDEQFNKPISAKAAEQDNDLARNFVIRTAKEITKLNIEEKVAAKKAADQAKLEQEKAKFEKKLDNFIKLLVGEVPADNKTDFVGRLKSAKAEETAKVRNDFASALKLSLNELIGKNDALKKIIESGSSEEQEKFISDSMRQVYKVGVFSGHAKFSYLGYNAPLSSFVELIVAAFSAVCGDRKAWDDWWEGRAQMQVTDMTGFKDDLVSHKDMFNKAFSDIAAQTKEKQVTK